jgi:hypothetical protein
MEKTHRFNVKSYSPQTSTFVGKREAMKRYVRLSKMLHKSSTYQKMFTENDLNETDIKRLEDQMAKTIEVVQEFLEALKAIKG